jgi:hypothetical protein
MRSGVDDEAFAKVIEDLCLAYNRPYTPEVTRVFWESLKWAHILDVKRTAQAHRDSSKKFPTPKDLAPERTRVSAPQRDPIESEQWSQWAIAANKILFSVAYQGHRGFKPMGDKLKACLVAKADYVEMAEDAAKHGQAWNEQEFNGMCREGFEKILGNVA